MADEQAGQGDAKPAGEAGAGDAKGGAPASAPATDTFEITHNGQKHTLNRDDMMRHASMGFDYTKKTQALSEEKKGLGKQVEDKALELFRKYKAEEDGGNDPQDDADKGKSSQREAELQKKLTNLEGRLNKSEQAEVQKQAKKDLDAMLGKMGDKYKDKGLTKADERLICLRFSEQANDETDADTLFDSLYADRVKERGDEKQAIIDEYVKVKRQDPFASGESDKSGSPGKAFEKSPTTFAEARDRAEARLRARQGS